MNNLFEQTLFRVANYLPQFLAGLAVMVVGFWLAKILKQAVAKLVSLVMRSSLINQTPVEESLKSANVEQYLDEGLGTLAYWLMLLLSLYVAASIWGLNAVSILISSLFSYSPRVISALVVLLLGLLFAGVVEKLVKNSLLHLDASTARAGGKISSYAVMVLAVLIALSEIGIAREFILIAFIGLVFCLSLGMGLALGLGGQGAVAQLISKIIKSDVAKTKRSGK